MFFFSILSLLISVPLNTFDEASIGDWFERTTLNNKEITSMRGWGHVFLVLVFTLLTIRAV